MTRLFRLFAVLTVLALVAAGCGGGDADTGAASDGATTSEAETDSADDSDDDSDTDDDSNDSVDDESEEAMEDEESGESEITTDDPVETETTSSSTTTSTEAPARTGPAFPLTGEVLEASDDPDHAAVVVKISNNNSTARAALDGLDAADIIYEERIEQQATRFAAVFHSELPEQVGSVRSGRTSDVNIVANLNRPVFGYSGANDGVHAQLREAEGNGILIRSSADFGDTEFTRISGFSAPDNMVADVSRLLDAAPADSEPPAPVYDYSNNVADLGQPSPGLLAEARDDAQYVWSESDAGYLRFQDGQPHVTRDGRQITPANVVVQTTTYLPSQIDASSVDAVTIGEGKVVVYSNGSRVEGTWTREFARDPYTLRTASGEVIGLAPGQTWVTLAPANTTTPLTNAGAEALIGQ